jgi:uncharacterized membrane protein
MPGTIALHPAYTSLRNPTMRKTAELLSLAALAALALITINLYFGPHSLPAAIPTHFDGAGNPNRWDSRHALLLLPILAGGLYLLLTVISRFPELFNYPVTVTELNRAQLEEVTLNLLAWVKVEAILFLVWIESAWVQAIRHPGNVMRPYPVFVFGAALFATIIGFIVAMFRAARAQ